MQFTALVPLKKDSRRLPNKNYLKLAGRPLTYHIFNALLKLESVERVCVFSSSDECMEHIPPGVEFIQRDARLDLDDVRGLDIYRSFAQMIHSDYYILAHATSPFISTASLQKGVDGIISGEYDSALSVSEIKKYFWYDSKPVNYNVHDIIQTQYLQPALIETSGFFMFSNDDILVRSRRIGDRPNLVSVNDVEAMDIDYIHEYLMARRFEDALLDEQEPSPQTGGKLHTAPSVRFILFELEMVLARDQGEAIEHVAQWLNILAGRDRKIGVVTRMDHNQAAALLAALEITAEFILTSKDGLNDDGAAILARQACSNAGVNPARSAYVGASPDSKRIAQLAGMQFLHAGWACHSGVIEDVNTFETIADAAIHILERGRW